MGRDGRRPVDDTCIIAACPRIFKPYLIVIMITVQQLVLHMPQLIGQIHVDLVGVDESLGLLPQGVKLPFAVFLDCLLYTSRCV